MLLNPTPCSYSSTFCGTTVRYYISENLLIIKVRGVFPRGANVVALLQFNYKKKKENFH